MIVRLRNFDNFGTFQIFNFLNGFWGCLRQVKSDFEREHEIICSQFALIWSKGFQMGLPLWFYPDLAQNQRARDPPDFLPSKYSTTCRFPPISGLEIFFLDDRFPHVIFILAQREKTQRHYFCDQDQTLDIFAGARAEDSAIMMVANIRRARHSLLKLFQREDGPLLPKA